MKNGLCKAMITLMIPLMLINWSGTSASATDLIELETPQDFSGIYNQEFPPNLAGSDEYPLMKDYLGFIGKDVHNYWYTLISNEGGIRVPPDVSYYFPLPGEKTPTPICGPVTYTDDETALFCPLGNRIFISQALAVKYWNGTYKRNNDVSQNYPAGDYSTALLVAHEYGHNLQENYHYGFPSTLRAQELHADCLAGVWGKSLFNAGRLEAGDAYEALRTFYDIGDYSKDPAVHRGTPAQRYGAYSTGYNEGTIGACYPYFNGYTGGN